MRIIPSLLKQQEKQNSLHQFLNKILHNSSPYLTSTRPNLTKFCNFSKFSCNLKKNASSPSTNANANLIAIQQIPKKARNNQKKKEKEGKENCKRKEKIENLAAIENCIFPNFQVLQKEEKKNKENNNKKFEILNVNNIGQLNNNSNLSACFTTKNTVNTENFQKILQQPLDQQNTSNKYKADIIKENKNDENDIVNNKIENFERFASNIEHRKTHNFSDKNNTQETFNQTFNFKSHIISKETTFINNQYQPLKIKTHLTKNYQKNSTKDHNIYNSKNLQQIKEERVMTLNSMDPGQQQQHNQNTSSNFNLGGNSNPEDMTGSQLVGDSVDGNNSNQNQILPSINSTQMPPNYNNLLTTDPSGSNWATGQITNADLLRLLSDFKFTKARRKSKA